MKILCIDPAAGSFGVAVLHVVNNTIHIPMHFVVNSPEMWDVSRKNSYVAHCAAAIISLEKPDVIVSEKPWGMGFSKDSLLQLIGAIKAETWANIQWQGITEARRGVLGDGHGGADKIKSAEWLLQYPFSVSAKNIIKKELSKAKDDGKTGYDILDAILHGLFYLVDLGKISPVHKEAKKKKSKKSSLNQGET